MPAPIIIQTGHAAGIVGAGSGTVKPLYTRTLSPKPRDQPVACRNCGRPLASPDEVAWECECGVRVCQDPDCFAEWFKQVAGGEATRCLACGLVT